MFEGKGIGAGGHSGGTGWARLKLLRFGEIGGGRRDALDALGLCVGAGHHVEVTVI
jgi:hypothetical protein